MIPPIRLSLGVLLLACATALPSCGAVGWIAQVFSPPRRVDAIYKPPKNKKILVFVDDKLQEMTYEPIKAEMTNLVNKQLMENKVVAAVVPYERMLELTSATTNFNDLSVAEVGRKLGADIVLHVQIDEFRLKDDPVSPLWRGQFKASVRMVDVTAGRLWPKDRLTGLPMPPIVTPTKEDSSLTYGTELSRRMVTQMADQITKLFYDHTVSIEESEKKDQNTGFPF